MSRPRLVGITLLVAVLAVAGLSVLLAEDRYVVGPQSTVVSSADPAAASVALADLAAALASGDADAASALAPAGDESATTLLGSLAGNVGLIGVRDLALRYIDAGDMPAADGSWSVLADLTWRIERFDPGTSRVEVEVGLRRDGNRLAVTGFIGGRVPLWLRGPARVDRRAGTLVITGGRPSAPYSSLAERALPQVRRVLSNVRGGLVVEVPQNSAELDSLLGVPEGTYQGVAAVTASVDGSTEGTSPVHVFVNPDEMDDLRRTGAQVVMTHEAVHALTAAPTSQAPVWLVEGFADFVALRDVDLPVTRTAAQVIARVRRDGVPARLPGAADFDLTAPHLGAAYEAAWLACVSLADLAGEAALVEVYRTVSAGAAVDDALRRSAGVDQASLTQRWRSVLRTLAEES